MPTFVYCLFSIKTDTIMQMCMLQPSVCINFWGKKTLAELSSHLKVTQNYNCTLSIQKANAALLQPDSHAKISGNSVVNSAVHF